MFSPNKNRRPALPKQSDTTEPPAKPMTTDVKKRLWTTVALTFILLIIWFGSIALGEIRQDPFILYVVMAVYFVAFAAILVTYLAYNRAFVNKDVTVDMLPADWSDERKQAFVDDTRRRAERSRWMVMLIIPFAVVFLVDALYLFVWDAHFAEFFRK